MKIQYSLAVDDYVGWRKWADHNVPRYIGARRWGEAVVALMTLILPVALVVTIHKNWDSMFAFGAAVAAGILIYIFTFLALKTSTAENTERLIRSDFVGRKSIGGLGQHSLELNDGVLIEKNDGEQLFSSLIRISEILESPEYVLIVLFNGTHLVPRNKVVEGDLELFIKKLRKELSAALEKYVEPETSAPQIVPPKKTRKGIYIFIAAAVIAIPSLISLAIKSSAGPGDMERCAKIINSCTNCERCTDFLRAEVFFYFSAPLCLLLLMISLYEFYKNLKAAGL